MTINNGPNNNVSCNDELIPDSKSIRASLQQNDIMRKITDSQPEKKNLYPDKIHKQS